MSHQQYSRWVTLASMAAVTTATLLILGKLIAWLMTDSSSLLASLTDSFMDISASLINLLAIRYALAPADEEIASATARRSPWRVWCSRPSSRGPPCCW